MRRTIRLALALVATTTLSNAQVTRAWIEEFAPRAPFTHATTSHVLPFPDGGVLAVSISHYGYDESVGEASLRRLTENGDLVWEITEYLPVDDYVGIDARKNVAGIDVGPSGEIAIGWGTSGPMDIRVYEPDGSLRWQRSIPVLTGPHWEDSTVRFASNGDVMFASNERLAFGGNTFRFGLYRLAAADGSQVWQRGAGSRQSVRMATGPGGTTVLAVNRNATGQQTWSVERWNAAGTRTGTAMYDMFAYLGAVSDVAVGSDGRAVATIADQLGGAVVGFDTNMGEQWYTYLPPPAWYMRVSLMADGDAIVTELGWNWDHLRVDADTGAAHYSAAHAVGSSRFVNPAALPNGNGVVALSKPGEAVELVLQERDPMGNVVRSHDAPTDEFDGSQAIAVGPRGNVYAAYQIEDSSGLVRGGLEKLVFEDEQGTSYCGPAVPNSTGASATILAAGSLDVPSNNLSLVFGALPPGTTVLPLASQSMGFVMQPGGSQGNLCLGGSVGRFDEPGEIRFADANGAASMQVELTAMPTPGGLVPAMSGETWNFQAWFRDSVPGQPSTSNFTDAVSISLL